MEEIRQILKCYSATIRQVSRLTKFNKDNPSSRKEPSMSIKIDFNCQTLPNKVFLDNIAFTVRKYNYPPLKCYRCQRPGLMSNGCSREEVCNICSGKHNMRDCTAESPKCANCGKAHVASSRDCQLNKDAVEIERMKRQGVSFANARKSIKISGAQQILNERGIDHVPNKRTSIQPITITAEVHQSQGSYHNIPASPPSQFKTKSRTTQNTSNANENQQDEKLNAIRRYVDEAIGMMTVKITSFLQEVFSLQLQKEHSKGRKLLLLNLAKHHFGMEIHSRLLDDHLDFNLDNLTGSPEKSAAETDELPTSQIINTKSIHKADKRKKDNDNEISNNPKRTKANNKSAPKDMKKSQTPRPPHGQQKRTSQRVKSCQ